VVVISGLRQGLLLKYKIHKHLFPFYLFFICMSIKFMLHKIKKSPLQLLDLLTMSLTCITKSGNPRPLYD
jgi:hypothetical protein